MKTAIYPGSFDPITNGHLDIIKKSANIFDKVIVAVSDNVQKKGFLPVEVRVELSKKCVSNMPNVEVLSYDGLTVDFARQNEIDTIIRGLRNSADFEYELQLAQTNKALYRNIETLFLITEPEFAFISSSAVREILSYKGDISKLVPAPVCDYFAK